MPHAGEAGEGEDEEVEQELELLRAMWPCETELEIRRAASGAGAEPEGFWEDDGPGGPVENPTAAAAVIARLAPSTGGDDQRQYLRCEVVITIPHGYPGDIEHPVPSQVRLGASSGLTDPRRVALQAALQDMLQVPELGALPGVLEAAKEQLTAWNDEGPSGECAICCAEMGGAGDSGSSDCIGGLLRLPCFHVFHATCFAQHWEAEWARQRDRAQDSGEVPPWALSISSAVVACPECRQVVSWADVPQIHSSPLLHAAIAEEGGGSCSEGDSGRKAQEEQDSDDVTGEGASKDTREDERDETVASPSLPGRKSGKLQEKAETARVSLFEVIAPRGLRSRRKPRFDARDQEGPVLKKGACGVIAESVEMSDATYIRPEGTEYWLPCKGGPCGVKMVRVDQDMPRPLKAPGGWIHGAESLGVAGVASPRSARPGGDAAAYPAESRAAAKERKKPAVDSAVTRAKRDKITISISEERKKPDSPGFGGYPSLGQAAAPAAEAAAPEAEEARVAAWVKLHHLFPSGDEKDRPLRNLLGELGVDAQVFYGTPGFLLVAGPKPAVDSVVTRAKRDKITISISEVFRGDLATGLGQASAFPPTGIHAVQPVQGRKVAREKLKEACAGLGEAGLECNLSKLMGG